MRRSFMLLLLIATTTICCAEAPVEFPAAAVTTGGSRLLGMLAAERPLMLRGEKGAQKLDLSNVQSITFGERYDPNLENDALVALGDLQSEQFDVREKALAKLRGLGRAAIRALKGAASSKDAEVSNRARALLAEMSVQNAAEVVGDRVALADGSTLRGELAAAELTFRSRWGRLRFPVQCLESVQMLKPEQVNAAKLAGGEETAITVPAPGAEGGGAEAERWDLREYIEAAPGRDWKDAAARALAGMRMLNMDHAPIPQPEGVGDKRTVALNAGDRLEDAYAPWGVLLRPTDSNATVQANLRAMEGISGGPAALLNNQSDLNINFIIPGSYDAKTARFRAGGVTMIGAFVWATVRSTIGLAVYDRAGRQLGQVVNLSGPEIPPGVPGLPDPVEFIGIRSKVPIVRARFFRIAEGKEQDLLLDDIVFDRVVSVDRPAGNASVLLSLGERIAGRVTAAALELGLSLQPEFLDAKAPPARIALDDVDRYEPARDAEPRASPTAKPARTGLGTPHGVLLQSGETFRARLMKLDAKEVAFLLPGGVELKLPREMLRKVDLSPPAPEPGELPPPTTVADDEKPGVDWRRKEQPKQDEPKKEDVKKEPEKKETPPAEPKAEEKKKKKKADPLHTTQEMARWDDAQILEIDISRGTAAGDIKVNYEQAEWGLGTANVRTLVFPKDPNATKATAKFRDWVLTLREGSRFEVVLIAIAPDAITVEMSGSVVTLPAHVIDSIQRKK